MKNSRLMKSKKEMIKLGMNKVFDLEKDVKQLKQVDHSTTILESIKFEVPEAVNKYLGTALEDTLQEDDVSKFIKVKQEPAAKEKMPKYSTTPYDQVAEDEHKQKEILFQMMMASKSHKKHPAYKELKRRHNDKDQDHPAGSDQGMNKRRTRKAAEPLKKFSKSKESAKGKTLSNTSKIGKSVSADKSVREPKHVVQIDVEEPNLNKMANDADEPQADTIPNIPKNDWFKKSPRPETLDPD
ncbi:hypothetical protein Tco_1121703 [Tanacetum coccineum]|uniref:Uncharacterized protein n=1 Tax=Tanacetum coccineum TaxID=301880 RepID=A0ABQ5IYG2_9ASTR